jgi:TfoX/Sxy family transcriptional regulator of competence genes
MAHDPKQLKAVFERACPPHIETRFKPMFGGIIAYAFDTPCCSLSDVGLALKLVGADHAELLATAGAERLRYAQDQPLSKTYVVVPEAMLDDPQMLGAWIERAATGAKAKTSKRRA